ncbi:WecB/TagA/CpsF family glycosyltransferase [Patescibacteria group bacterium]|nr:WecB/TagA/CpsF family glycosyltransferase [Patescibacteria group bacterium]
MVDILGFKISDLSIDQTIEKIVDLIKTPGKHLILTANPEILVKAFFNKEYYLVLSSADLILADGFGIILAARYLKKSIRNGRVTGVDLLKEIAKQSDKLGFRLYLTGLKQDILNFATQRIKEDYAKVNIVGFKKGPIFSLNDLNGLDNNLDNIELINNINFCQPNIIFVGFGSPKQEIWLKSYFNKIEPNIGIGVGGAIDYLSGIAKQPPEIIKRFGLEWLWRLIRQPRRVLRIVTAVIVFPVLVFLYKDKVPHRTEH